ncbi:MAG: LysM peptidoglycan-binding domain-containing protein [Rhodospirillaceae bacterium]|nr:LysM peptidoglycan-binding domain-containing protein [Rhodospirillaceae bacterium]
MDLSVCRELRGASLTAARRFGRLVAMVAFAGLGASLAGCQTATVVPSDAEGAGEPADAVPQRRAEAPVQSGKPPIVSESRSPQPADPSDAAQIDLIERIRAGLVLPSASESAIDRELDWYVANADYLNRVLTRSERYLHHIVEALEQNGMPLDLALLPIVESAYDPFAYSRGRAAGLWQIIPGTGRELGLKQDWWYDGRRDVLESTDAALRYLRQLEQQFEGDWLLAVAGYNAGGGGVSRALRRAAGEGRPTDFWGVRPYLPVETRTYVPRLMALARLVADPARYGVAFPGIANEPYFQVIETGGQVDMALAARIAGMSTDELYLLNPGVNHWATDPDGPHRLLVPFDTAENLEAALASGDSLAGVRWIRHKVSTGETLSHLAIEYQTTPDVLRQANGIAGDLIRAGQGLMVPQPTGTSDGYGLLAAALAEGADDPANGERRQTYVVQSGDSLWSVARRYGVTVADLAQWNALSPQDILGIGRELVVWSDSPVFVPTANQRIRRVTYTVRQGDSLYRISTQFRVSVADLLQWNNLSPEHYLQPGQQLILFVDVTDQST